MLRRLDAAPKKYPAPTTRASTTRTQTTTFIKPPHRFGACSGAFIWASSIIGRSIRTPQNGHPRRRLIRGGDQSLSAQRPTGFEGFAASVTLAADVECVADLAAVVARGGPVKSYVVPRPGPEISLHHVRRGHRAGPRRAHAEEGDRLGPHRPRLP